MPHHSTPPPTPKVLSSFQPASITEIAKHVHDSPIKQCDVHPIPTFLLKQVCATILLIMTTIVNLCLSTDTFPIHLKQSLVSLLLKKTSLNKYTLNNYHPISNLFWNSKITERIVKSCLNVHLSSISLYNHNQSVYAKHHSTETNLLSLHDHLITAVSHQQVSCLCLLGLLLLLTSSITQFSAIISHPDLESETLPLHGLKLNYYLALSLTLPLVLHPLSCGIPQDSVLHSILFQHVHKTSQQSHLIPVIKSSHLCWWHSTIYFFFT